MEQLVIRSEAAPESEEYQKEMADKFDKAQASIDAPSTLLAGKYPSETELERGIVELAKKVSGGNLEEFYKNLERQLGKPQSEPQDVNKQPSEPEAPQETQTKVDFSKYETEFLNTGGLSEESYQELEQAGFPKALVDAYIAGQQALASQFQQQVMNTVGGEAAYQEMIRWASQALSPDEKEAYNRILDSGDLSAIKLAVEALHAKFQRMNPKLPRLIKGEGTQGSLVGYASIAEMLRDMQDPRYDKDPAFRRSVEQRLAVSNIF